MSGLYDRILHIRWIGDEWAKTTGIGFESRPIFALDELKNLTKKPLRRLGIFLLR